MKANIPWRIREGLHQLYESKNKQIRKPLLNNLYVNEVMSKQMYLLNYKEGNHNVVVYNDGFIAYYKENFLSEYLYYKEFFDTSGILKSGHKNYTTEDLQALILIFKNKSTLVKGLTTVRTFSSKTFENEDSKYLESKKGLLKDIILLLGIEKFPAEDPKEQQWRFIIDCREPKYVLLCENLDFLKSPWMFRENNIELWYAGGNNTPKLEEMAEKYLDLPLFYVCDWDQNGLEIYQNVYDIYDKKDKKVNLLIPRDSKPKPINTGKHKSKWKTKEKTLLKKRYYNSEQEQLLQKLIANNQWIEEQTIDPIPLIINYLKNL
ncbi:hypothetical protein OAV05_02160 [Flavobacteriaceae bacterium]|nr:hypothetical protein [Flavobacteriaceae bacterium]